MVARRRLIQALKELLFGGGFVLLYATGLPFFFSFLKVEWSFLPAWKAWGLRALVVAPLLFAFFYWRQHRYITGRYRRAQLDLEQTGITYSLLLRADGKPVDPAKVHLWSHVGDVLPRDGHVAFEVAGSGEMVQLLFRAVPGVDRALMTQISAEWPGTQARVVRPADDPLALDEGRFGWWCELMPRSAHAPVVAASADPLRALLSELGRLPGGVRAGMQVLVRGDAFTRQAVGGKAAKAVLDQAQTGKKYKLPVTLETKRQSTGLDQRAQHIFVEVRLRVWATAGSQAMAQSVARSLSRAVLSQYGPSNPLRQSAEGEGAPTARDFPPFAGRPWTDEELGRLAHLVGSDVRTLVPQLAVASANPLPPSPACRVPKGARLTARLKQPAAPRAGEAIIEEDEVIAIA